MAPNTAAGASVARGYFAIIDKAPRHTLQMVSSSPMSPRILSQRAARWQGSPTYTSLRSGCTNPIHRSTWRNCLKSPEGASNVASQGTEAPLFGPFRPRYTGQIHPLSVAHTPFQTVSLETVWKIARGVWIVCYW